MGLAVKPKKSIENIDCVSRISGLYLNSSFTTSVNMGPDWSITEASYSHPLCSGREPVTIMALPSYSAIFISCDATNSSAMDAGFFIRVSLTVQH